jgi:hypothetical protein
VLLPGRQRAPLFGVKELAKDSVVGVNLGCLRAPVNTMSVSDKKNVEHSTPGVLFSCSRTAPAPRTYLQLAAAAMHGSALVGPSA